MEGKGLVTILMFGSLYSFRQERGLAPALELPLPPGGKRALDIAGELGLPLDAIGAIYCNHRPAGLQRLIHPGDRIAFVPKSIPGPHNGPLGFPILDSDEALRQVARG
ncbi:MAG TPA: MoaD/ThiS family protein [Desulfuromonadales bacterium]|nr:MoaD/ThiS family protein [Desulfuromonadales bacterium]